MLKFVECSLMWDVDQNSFSSMESAERLNKTINQWLLDNFQHLGEIQLPL